MSIFFKIYDTIISKKGWKAINDFFNSAKPYEYIEANNEVINIFLERALKKEDPFSPEHVKSIVHIITQQSKLIAQLFEAGYNAK